MAKGFKEGNKYWQCRLKDGRRPDYENAKQLYEDIESYFEDTSKRKWTRKDWVGKDAKQVTRETETPFTIAGLCIFLGQSRNWWNEFKKACIEQGKTEMLEVIYWCEDVMHMQKFEGAVVGAFNASIIARDLSLVEKTENEQIIKVKYDEDE